MSRMKIPFAAAAVAAVLSCNGCGGGGNGGGAGPAPVGVRPAANPVLINYSTTVTADFGLYTSAVRSGSRVDFSVTPGATISAPTVTGAGGIATVHVSSSSPGTFAVSAASGTHSGAATVTFIRQPASAEVYFAPGSALTRLQGAQFNLDRSFPATFSKISTAVTLPKDASPPLKSWTDAGSLAIWSYVNSDPAAFAAGISLPRGTPLVMLRFKDLTNVPNFSIRPRSVIFTDPDGRDIAAPGTATVRYYDASRNLLLDAKLTEK
jgi:hypothetical protein